MSEKSKKEAGRKAAKPRAGVAVAARNGARKIKKTPVFDDVSPQKKLREALRSLLPRVFAGGRLDIDALCESLGESREAVARERYRFEWVGRADSVRLLEQNPALALRPCRGESVDFEATRNLYLEGDNLSVLRLLNRAYAGRVKMIYIDPPYNTGNDFVYNDKFGESFAAYEARAGEAESAGAREESKRNGANRHSFWLSMMFPRLLLARDLLRDDGVIFVSIDDNEVHHLRLLLNAVFGEENFVGELIHQRAKGGGNAKGVVKGHDYIVVYAKMKADDSQLRRKKVVQGKTVEKDGVKYIVDDDVVRKVFGKYSGKDDRRCFYEELLEFKSPEKKREVDEAILAGRYFLKPHKSGKNMICRLIPVDKARSKLYSIIKVLSEKGSQDIESLGIVYDDYPKPVELLRQLVDSASTEAGDIVMDFFSGSATTAHAVMELNAEDGGMRQCVSVQLPEETDEKSETRKAGFATIADLGKERLRRAGQKIRDAQNGDAETDIGFRVFKIAPAVLRRRISEEKAARQKRLDTENAEAQLYEIALAEGLSLTAQIEERKIGKNTVHQISDALNGRRLHICLDSKIAADFPRKSIAEKGETVICRDDAMSDEIALNLSFHYNLKVL